MDIGLRKTLNGCKLIDFEEGNGHVGIYLEDEHGTVYAVNIKGEYENTNLLEEKKAAPEVQVQEQPITVKVKITNLNEFQSLLADIMEKINKLRDFKPMIKIER